MGKYSGKNSRITSSGSKTGWSTGGDKLGSFPIKNGKAGGAKESKINRILNSVRPSGGNSRYRNSLLSRFNDFLSTAIRSGIDAVRFIINYLRDNRSVLFGIVAGIVLAFLVILIIDFHHVRQLAHYRPNETTCIYDRNGILVSELFRQKREVVGLEKMPADLKKAFISIEDSEFYDHMGINFKGVVRAFFINIFSGRIRQGGSTITQQLAKVLLTSGERTMYRKVKEVFIAFMIEFYYSKDEILEMYLNQIFLGHGAYGVEAASRLYFGRHVWELDLAQASLLAALPSAPNLYSPIRYPERALRRHRIVLGRMVEEGFISVKQAEKAYLDFWPDYLDYISNLPPSLSTMTTRVDRAPWFTEYIRRKLVTKYGEEMVYEKGLDVYTTLDLTKQLSAQRVLEDSLERQNSVSASLLFKNDEYIQDNFGPVVELFADLYGLGSFQRSGSRDVERFNNEVRVHIAEELQGLNFFAGLDSVCDLVDRFQGNSDDREFQKVEGCLVSIDHRTGYIEALVGGSEFSSINQLNRAMQSRRQPGSAIKPLLYAAAIESGQFTPATSVLDSPLVYLDNEGGDWIPENYEGEYYGLVRLRRALALSINVVSIRIADKLGIGYVMDYYGKLLGFDKKTTKNRIPRNFSIALGSMEVSPFELTRAYAVIANGGKDVIPFSIRYVKDRDGKVLENQEDEIKGQLAQEEKNGNIQIIRADTARILTSMMRSVIEEGTGKSASPGRPAAGKTGTTNNWKDAWFVGFTPDVTTGIWVGYDKMGLSLGIGQAGGGVAAPPWGAYMRDALSGTPVSDFSVYAPVAEAEICSRSGLLPSPACRSRLHEIFREGTVPAEECTMCSEGRGGAGLSSGRPDENISRRQKEAVMKNIKKQNTDSMIDTIGKDLLDK